MILPPLVFPAVTYTLVFIMFACMNDPYGNPSQCTGRIFTTLTFLHKLQMGPIN
jgi:hypothetical protein